MSSTPLRKHDDDSRKIAWGAFAAGLIAAVIGATHLDTAPQWHHPGGGCLIVGIIQMGAAAATLAKLEKRKRTLRRLNAFEDARLSPGQLAAKYDRDVNLGPHLYDADVDTIPDGEKARLAWLDGRTIGPVNEADSDPATKVGIYQAADPLPLFSQLNDGNRAFLVIFGLGVLAIAACTIAVA